MSKRATATFQVKSWDEKPYNEIDEGPKLTRASVTKSFRGDIEGEGILEYLMIHRDDGSASFVGLERVVGPCRGSIGKLRPPAQWHLPGRHGEGHLVRGAGLGHRGPARPARRGWLRFCARGGLLHHTRIRLRVTRPTRRGESEAAPMFDLEGIDHVALAVRDVQRSLAWYQEVLGLERRFEDVWGDYPAVVGVGTTSIALFPVEGPVGPDPRPSIGRDALVMRHLAFRVDRKNFIEAQADLKRRGIAFEFQDHDVAHSIYFDDPDAHEIEITTYDL